MGPSDLAGAEMLANFCWVVLAHIDGMEGAEKVYEGDLILFPYLHKVYHRPQTGVAMVDLASTSTTHSFSVSEPLRFGSCSKMMLMLDNCWAVLAHGDCMGGVVTV